MPAEAVMVSIASLREEAGPAILRPSPMCRLWRWLASIWQRRSS